MKSPYELLEIVEVISEAESKANSEMIPITPKEGKSTQVSKKEKVEVALKHAGRLIKAAANTDPTGIAGAICDIVGNIYEQIKLAQTNKEQFTLLSIRIICMSNAINGLEKIPDSEPYIRALIDFQECLKECLKLINKFNSEPKQQKIPFAELYDGKFKDISKKLKLLDSALELGLLAKGIFDHKRDKEALRKDLEEIKDLQRKTMEQLAKNEEENKQQHEEFKKQFLKLIPLPTSSVADYDKYIDELLFTIKTIKNSVKEIIKRDHHDDALEAKLEEVIQQRDTLVLTLLTKDQAPSYLEQRIIKKLAHLKNLIDQAKSRFPSTSLPQSPRVLGALATHDPHLGSPIVAPSASPATNCSSPLAASWSPGHFKPAKPLLAATSSTSPLLRSPLNSPRSRSLRDSHSAYAPQPLDRVTTPAHSK